MSDQPTTLSEVDAERLSLIRYQLLAAEESMNAPAPINNLSINVMQDVVESTLALAGDHLRAEVRHKDFDKLFDAVVGKLGDPAEIVGLRAPAIALNNARVSFKHHGNQLRDATLRRHHDVAVTFVNELVEAAFHIRLEQVSLLLFVKDEQARSLIEDAERIAEAGNVIEALFRLRLAFDLAVKEYELRKTVDGWYPIFATKPSFFPSVFDLRDIGGKHMEKIVEWIEAIDDLTRLGALGIDTQRYAHFNAVAPLPIYFGSDHPTARRVRFENPTLEHFRASHRFVIDSAIRLATNDYTLQPSRLPALLRDRHFDPDYVGTPVIVHAPATPKGGGETS